MIKPLDNNDFLILSREYNVPVRIVQQDYAALAALDIIAFSELKEFLGFKGGTAIRRAYFPDARFSVDLDFDYLYKIDQLALEEQISIIAEDIWRKFKNVFEREVSGSVLFGVVNPPIISRKWITIAVDYKMPGMASFLRIDVNFANLSQKEYSWRRILVEPFEGTSGDIKVLSLKDIFIDKVYAIYDRTNAKDLWDIYYLIKHGFKLSIRLNDRVNLSLDRILKAIDFVSESDWALLQDYLPSNLKTPVIGEVKRIVKEFIVKNW